MNVNGIDYPIETPTYVLNENFRNFAPEGLTTVAVSGDEYTSAIILKTPRYYKNLDLSEYTARAYYYTHWLDDEQKSSEGSIPLYNYEVQENNIIYVWQLDINQTYKKGRVDFGLSWSNDDWKLNTKGCYFVVQRFVNTEGSYIAPDIAEQLQAEIDKLFATKQDKQDKSLETEEKTVVGAINELNDFKNRPEGFATTLQGEKADIALLQKTGYDLDNIIDVEIGKIYQCTETANANNSTIQYNEESKTTFIEGCFYKYFAINSYYLIDVQDLSDYYTKSETNALLNDKQDTLGVIEKNVFLTDKVFAFDNIPHINSSSLMPEEVMDLTPKGYVDNAINDHHDNTKADISYVDNADNNLQSQIDALASSSDVVDVVGTYAELQAYDTQHLKNNDIVKVLQDETKDDAITYYRWVINQQTHTGSWEYIGQSGPYYTKSETQEYVSEATANFITNTVNNLTNYYLKSETYNKTEVNNLIGAIQTAHFEIVNVLPPIGESNVIYLILRSDPETSNIYDEYIYIDNAYEKIGSTDVDLTGYATESWVNQQIANFLTQSQIQSLINTALTNYYTKTETDDLLKDKADVNGIYDEMVVGNAQNLVSTKKINDNTPYNFRTSGSSLDIKSGVGNLEEDSLVGGTVAWNQLCPALNTDNFSALSANGTITNYVDNTVEYTVTNLSGEDSLRFRIQQNTVERYIQGHKYLITYNVKTPRALTTKPYAYSYDAGGVVFVLNPSETTDNTWCNVSFIVIASVTGSAGLRIAIPYDASIQINDIFYFSKPQIFDLTQMFGESIANHIYNLEQTTTGAGLAYFKSLFPKDYYEYDAGTFISVKTSAHKMVGFNAYNPSTGEAKLVGNRKYQITGTYTELSFEGTSVTPDSDGYFTPDKDGILTVTNGNNADTCIHLVWDGVRDNEYEEYKEYNYPLDSDLELKGIPKLDVNNKLYYDGDRYRSDGIVTREFKQIKIGNISNYGFYGNTGHVFRIIVVDAKAYENSEFGKYALFSNDYIQSANYASYNPQYNYSYFILTSGNATSFYIRNDNWQWFKDLSDYEEAPDFVNTSSKHYYKKCSVATYADLARFINTIGTEISSQPYIIEVRDDEEQGNTTTYYRFNPPNLLYIDSDVKSPSYGVLLTKPSDWDSNWSAYYEQDISKITQIMDSLSNIDIIYPLATLNTEQATPYTNPQYVNDWGTEEYVDSRAVAIPVGHNTKYTVNLKSKLEMAPNSPNQGDGDYLVRQTDGINEYIKYTAPEIPIKSISQNGTPITPDSSGNVNITGGGGTVDQTYDPTSQNAQSGTAVAEAVEDKLTEPSSGLAVGKYFRVASIDADGHAVLECVDAPTPIEKDYELIQKVIIGYSITTTQPADWTTNYTDYFVNTGTIKEPIYTAVQGETAPDWEEGMYYSFSNSITDLTIRKEPNGENYNFKKIRLEIAQESSSSTALAFSINDAGTGYPYSLANTKCYFVVEAEIQNGRLYLRCSKAVNDVRIGATDWSSQLFNRAYGYLAFENITSFRFNKQGNIIPSNSEIVIYGVRV